MQPFILAARVILFRFLRLLIAITVESWVYRRGFKISPKQGVEYAVMINLFAEIFGIVVFSVLQSLFPLNLIRHTVIFLLLDEFPTISIDILLLTLFYFMLYLLTKFVGILFLNLFIFDDVQTNSEQIMATSKFEKFNQWGNQIKVITKAHSISYGVTLLFAFLKVSVFNL